MITCAWINDCRDELFVCLNIVCSIIRGCESVLPVWKETPLELVKSSLKWTPVTPTCGMKGYITMPDGSNVRHYLAGVMSEVQRAMLENAEDNTKSFFVLIRVRVHGPILESLHMKLIF